jgi:translation initiation factor IF-1
MVKESKDILEAQGIVIETSNSKFRVQISDGYIVLCTLSGKIRQNSVRILLGDKVKIRIGEYDTTQGIIVFRMKA